MVEGPSDSRTPLLGVPRDVMVRRLRNTPSTVIEDLAQQIVDMLPAVAGTRRCAVASIVVEDLFYGGRRVSGAYSPWDQKLHIDIERAQPLITYLQALAEGRAGDLPADALSSARDVVDTIVHEGLHSAGPDGGPMVEALTDLLTSRRLDAVVEALGLNDLIGHEDPLYGGYPGMAAYLGELVRYASRRTGLTEDAILLELQSEKNGGGVSGRLVALVGADPQHARAIRQDFSSQWQAIWPVVERRNRLPLEQQRGIMRPLLEQGRRMGREMVRSLGG